MDLHSMTQSEISESRALAQAIPTLAPGAERRAEREAARLGALWSDLVDEVRWTATVTRIDVELGVATLAVHPDDRASERGDNCWWDYRFDHFLKRWAESSVPTEVTCLLREALRERRWPETVIFSQSATHDGAAQSAEERVAPDAVVVVGEELMAFDAQISSCARAVGAHTRLHRDVESAQAELARGRLQPRCILIDARSPDGGAFVGWLRDQVRFFDVPVIALADEVSDTDFIATAELGADDALVPGELGRALTRRLAALERYVPGSHPKAATAVWTMRGEARNSE
jgi:CheY-like chemotaxis protein